MEELLKTYASVIELPIAWSEMDAFQHINNVFYLKYAESGRVDYLQKLSFMDPYEDEDNPMGPIVGEIRCKYKAPLVFPDQVSVATKVDLDTLESDRFWMQQIIVSHKTQGVVAEVRAKIVSYDYQKLGKTPLPEKVRRQILEIQKQEN